MLSRRIESGGRSFFLNFVAFSEDDKLELIFVCSIDCGSPCFRSGLDLIFFCSIECGSSCFRLGAAFLRCDVFRAFETLWKESRIIIKLLLLYAQHGIQKKGNTEKEKLPTNEQNGP